MGSNPIHWTKINYMKTKYVKQTDSIKEIKKSLKESTEKLHNSLKNDISNFLSSKGFTKYQWQIDGNKITTTEENWYIDPTGTISIDFRYVYSNHVHFMIGKKNTYNEYFFSIGNIRWFFGSIEIETFYEEKLSKIIDNIINDVPIETTGSYFIIK